MWFFAGLGGIKPAKDISLRNVPAGHRKLAGGKTVPAVAAPGPGLRVVSVLRGRRKWGVYTLATAPPGRIPKGDRSGDGSGDPLLPILIWPHLQRC